MTNKIVLILIFLLFNTFSSQQIKVEYIFIKSPISSVKEKLYIKDKNVISILDSLSNFSDNDSKIHNLKKTFPTRISSSINQNVRKFNIIEVIDGQEKFYEIEDIIDKPNWKIDLNNSKKILNYLCYKATTEFRGRKFTAYFTKEIPLNTGPFKFFGLDGLILEVTADNLPYYLWKATSIELNNNDKINYKLFEEKDKPINIKEFIEIKDNERSQFFKKMEDSNLPYESTIEIIPNRPTIEIMYEWENNINKRACLLPTASLAQAGVKFHV